MEWIDTHAHLDDPRLATRLDELLHAAKVAGVVQVVSIGTTLANSRRIVQTAAARPEVFAAVGIHPNDAGEAGPGDWAEIERLAEEPGVVALGETGLDLYWKKTPFDLQQDYFDRHLRLARRLDKAVVIHTRDCQRELLDQLARFGGPIRGVLHSFTGSWQDAEEGLALGLHVSFAGMITFKNKALDSLRDVAARVPSDRILVETDSPYLTPEPYRGKPNEPANVVHTGRRIAELRNLSEDDFARPTSANARRLFGLPTLA